MRRRLATLALAGTLGITGAAGAVLAGPAVSYAASGDATAFDDRVASLREALSELVSEGTITSSQADEVATTLGERPPQGHPGRGGPGGGRQLLVATAEALDLSEDESRTAARQGRTLAELADQQGVSTSAVVDAVVAQAQTRLVERVADGGPTQEEADAKAAEFEERLTESVDEPLRPARGHGGHGRHGHGDPSAQDDS